VPFGEELFVLDKDADDWLTRLNIPVKYERQDIKTRRYEKPERRYVNNGRLTHTVVEVFKVENENWKRIGIFN
jgi:hypothetical protein